MSLEEAEQWPDLLEIVGRRVKPERDKLETTTQRRDKRVLVAVWATYAPNSTQRIAPLDRCLVTAQTLKHLASLFSLPIGFHPHAVVFRGSTLSRSSRVFSPGSTTCGRLPSSPRWKNDSTLYAQRLLSTPFHSPTRIQGLVIAGLEDIGKRLYETRAQFMVDTDQGLTKTYNALKDPTVHDPRVEELRQLHIEMDQAVLAAYAEHTGDKTWLDIEVPPYTDPQTPAEKALHQTFEDEILDHLFALNEQRANR